VLRGGSWNNNQHNARCAYRNRNNPNNRNDNIGFRVVVSHNSQWSLPEMLPGLRWEDEAREMAWPGPGPSLVVFDTSRANIE
jgi:hypothetical protein